MLVLVKKTNQFKLNPIHMFSLEVFPFNTFRKEFDENNSAHKKN